jgi:mono/diheme cytochrome c family protein
VHVNFNYTIMQLSKIFKRLISSPLSITVSFLVLCCMLVLHNACNERNPKNIQDTQPGMASDGPADTSKPKPHVLGDAGRGKEVFRFETFGNEGFWFNAMRWQQGVVDSKLTPKQMLEIGLQIDTEAEGLDASLRKKLEAEFTTDQSPRQAPLLNNPQTTIALLNANAFIGVVAKDSDGDKQLSILKGDMVGVSCAICHTVTDKSFFDMPGAGSAGKRIDGPAPLTFNMGRFLAIANNSRAYYPNLQQIFVGVSIGRAARGMRPTSTEKEVDEYLSNPKLYPVGTFDETSDGNGNSVKNVPLFRQDLAAPYGTSGEFELFDDISNSSYTTNLDLTTLATPEGLEFLKGLGGPAGEQIHKEYKEILKETGVTGYPYVQAKKEGKPGELHNTVGRRVDDQKLQDMTAYVFTLPAPPAPKVNEEMAMRGRELFRTNCTSCHNIDQSKQVPATMVDLKTLWPGYTPVVVGLRGNKKLSKILNSPGDFDDKMVIVDASAHGAPRGNAMPLLLDLARTTVFLHDASVKSLGELLNPERGKTSPHPFYIEDKNQRADLVEFLRGLDTDSTKMINDKNLAKNNETIDWIR